MTEQALTLQEETFSLASLPEELQAKILAAGEQLRNSASVNVSRIRLDAKSFTLPDGNEVPSFSGIILAAKHANIHYAAEYEDGKSNPPDCVAIIAGQNDKKNSDLSPISEVSTPYCTSCKDCARFQWGSARDGKGKGKDCHEHVLLAVNVPSISDEIWVLEAKKTNVKVADGYLNTVTSKFGHPIAVLTNFTTGTKTKWVHEYTAQSLVNKDLASKLAERIEEANEILSARVIDSYNRGLLSTTIDAAPAAAETNVKRMPRTQ